jgi:hypothetical protein
LSQKGNDTMSAIDPTKPITGTPSTQSVRDNFSIAKTEIEAIIARLVALELIYSPESLTSWNPVDAGTNITLTNSNRTMQESRGGETSIRSLTSKTTGKHYAEFLMHGSWSSGTAVGFADATTAAGAGLNSWLGTISKSAGIKGTNSASGACSWVTNMMGSTSDPVPSLLADSVIGIGIDCDNQTAFFWKNGVLIATFTGLAPGPYFLMASTYDFSARVTIQATPAFLPNTFQSWT